VITFFKVENFKNLVQLQVEFGRIGVLIGPNGCGKSSLLQSIDFLRAFFMPSIDLYLYEKGWDYKDLPNVRTGKRNISWEVHVELQDPRDPERRLLFEYGVTLQPQLTLASEKLYLTDGGERIQVVDRKGKELRIRSNKQEKLNYMGFFNTHCSVIATLEDEDEDYYEMNLFRRFMTNIRSYLFWDPKLLRGRDRGSHSELGSSGEHLATVLAHLKNKEPEAFAKLLKRLRTFVPAISDISVKGGKGWGWKEIVLHEESDRNELTLNSRQISDGILRLLAVLTFRYSSRRPLLLTFEELENGVHPQLLKELVSVITELTQLKGVKTQVLMTTHSPYLLDEFIDQAESVYIMEKGQPLGGAEITRLKDRKDLDLAKELYSQSLGELWYTGLIGGNAGGTGK